LKCAKGGAAGKRGKVKNERAVSLINLNLWRGPGGGEKKKMRGDLSTFLRRRLKGEKKKGRWSLPFLSRNFQKREKGLRAHLRARFEKKKGKRRKERDFS